MVRPRMQPSNSWRRRAFISRGSTQLLVGPASALWMLQMKVRSSTRATSEGSERARKLPGRLSAVERQQRAVADQLRAQPAVLLLGAVAPDDALRAGQIARPPSPTGAGAGAGRSRGSPDWLNAAGLRRVAVVHGYASPRRDILASRDIVVLMADDVSTLGSGGWGIGYNRGLAGRLNLCAVATARPADCVTPILAFDIETIPDVAGLRRLYDAPASLSRSGGRGAGVRAPAPG